MAKLRFISSHGYAKQLISTSLFILLGSTFEFIVLFFMWVHKFHPISKRLPRIYK